MDVCYLYSLFSCFIMAVMASFSPLPSLIFFLFFVVFLFCFLFTSYASSASFLIPSLFFTFRRVLLSVINFFSLRLICPKAFLRRRLIISLCLFHFFVLPPLFLSLPFVPSFFFVMARLAGVQVPCSSQSQVSFREKRGSLASVFCSRLHGGPGSSLPG